MPRNRASSTKTRKAPFAGRPAALRYGAIGALLVVLFAPIYWFWASGQLERAGILLAKGTDQYLVKVGLGASQVRVVRIPGKVDGNVATKFSTQQRDQLIRALGANADESLLSFDLAAGKQRLEQLPWVRRAVIARAFPTTLRLEVEERVPFASWRSDDGATVYVDGNGEQFPAAIASGGGTSAGGLFALEGDGALSAAAGLYRAIHDNPALRSAISRAFWVDGRRWNLELQGNIVAKMPAGELIAASAELSQLIAEEKLLYYPLEIVDFRLADRTVLRFKDRRLGEEELVKLPDVDERIASIPIPRGHLQFSTGTTKPAN